MESTKNIDQKNNNECEVVYNKSKIEENGKESGIDSDGSETSQDEFPSLTNQTFTEDSSYASSSPTENVGEDLDVSVESGPFNDSLLKVEPVKLAEVLENSAKISSLKSDKGKSEPCLLDLPDSVECESLDGSRTPIEFAVECKAYFQQRLQEAENLKTKWKLKKIKTNNPTGEKQEAPKSLLDFKMDHLRNELVSLILSL